MAIQTSHVGSLPRSQKVVDYIFSREKGEDYNKIENKSNDQNNESTVENKQNRSSAVSRRVGIPCSPPIFPFLKVKDLNPTPHHGVPQPFTRSHS